ncbi:hypothetical protein CLUG_05292 [Clavispora lusitaniae ATCC 42720]|uniref:Uncharacterized protein n=1 Tax=Clavispora lusitaniae (strain ATCC 42720) TaxID=306902 RepID=C4YAR4_CLAL4|nr:uncharacterized protein CLUG_05292 [Clavispora lusitaniae ATCC 42720]EEQ41163.1 hypothetical protein CLUG_05292 [Clavispora lusitaniae ATCC 42720]
MNCFTLLGNIFIVQVVEVTGFASVENVRVTQSQKSVVSDGPASSVDGTSLWWRTIELELSVGNNGTDSAVSISQDRVLQLHHQRVRRETSFWDDSVWRSSGRGSNLAVADLGSSSGSGGSGGLVLNLTVTNLVHGRGSLVLDLAITDLVHHGSGLVLDLTIANSVDNRNGSVLDLAIANLVDNWGCGGGRHRRKSLGGLLLHLAIANSVDNVSLLSRRSGQSGRRSQRKGDNLDTKLGSVVSLGTRESCSRCQGGPWLRCNSSSQRAGSQSQCGERVLHSRLMDVVVVCSDEKNIYGERLQSFKYVYPNRSRHDLPSPVAALTQPLRLSASANLPYMCIDAG